MASIGTITDGDEIYFYFEMLRSSGVQKVLDVGMFLKRIGAVSRQVMDCEIPESVQLCGIDFFPETNMAVYTNIYDEILTKEQFFRQNRALWNQHYFDVAVLLETETYLSEEEDGILWNHILQMAENVMSDAATAQRQTERGRIKGYYPVSVGAKTYAWIPLSELRGECK